jgi:hypothetical protein
MVRRFHISCFRGEIGGIGEIDGMGDLLASIVGINIAICSNIVANDTALTCMIDSFFSWLTSLATIETHLCMRGWGEQVIEVVRGRV